ncbi:Na+/H+ antiporter NhaC [Sporosarcina thermotolerans]|uniref:Na+/H+ antiporter NhaC n=1 Tax=Sporosarcina thermotolerans TaxID=633404 RepID=A0AAW9A7R5_9BACL|nr:Na+/H+ antiporter NhaC [Sporosarcina thermotolerans]MDW0117447.1 Na+/H+ antiporter NhaC [Sporosarcina thermotolerans]
MRKTVKPSLGYSIMLVLLAVLMISVGMIAFKASIQIMMFITMLSIIPFVMRLGYNYKQVEEFMFSMMGKVMNPILIIMAVGALIGAWILAGTVPTMIFYGLKLVSPEFFLLTSLLFCSIVSLGTGTSFGTMGTAGLALIGMGHVLGVPPGMTAGAIISGAYFGDKMSPLSDSTNIVAAMSGSDLFKHIKHMLWTTVPAYILTAIIFGVIDFTRDGSANSSDIDAILGYLSEGFNLGFVPLIPILVLIVLLVLKKPAVTSIFVAALTGGFIAIVYQGNTISTALNTLYTGYRFESGIAAMDSLLQRGGVSSMLGIVALFLLALGLGGLLQGSGALNTILDAFASRIKSVGGLIATTVIVSYITVGASGVISFAAAITGTLMKPLYKQFGVRPENLSRTIEDTATQSAALFPWSINSIFAAATLGVSPAAFIPFCFLAFITPVFTLIYGFTGFTITRIDSEEIDME